MSTPTTTNTWGGRIPEASLTLICGNDAETLSAIAMSIMFDVLGASNSVFVATDAVRADKVHCRWRPGAPNPIILRSTTGEQVKPSELHAVLAYIPKPALVVVDNVRELGWQSVGMQLAAAAVGYEAQVVAVASDNGPSVPTESVASVLTCIHRTLVHDKNRYGATQLDLHFVIKNGEVVWDD